jgi:hypothetical protein
MENLNNNYSGYQRKNLQENTNTIIADKRNGYRNQNNRARSSYG